MRALERVHIWPVDDGIAARDRQWVAALLEALALLGIDPDEVRGSSPRPLIDDPRAMVNHALRPVGLRLLARPAPAPARPESGHPGICLCERRYPDRAVPRP